MQIIQPEDIFFTKLKSTHFMFRSTRTLLVAWINGRSFIRDGAYAALLRASACIKTKQLMYNKPQELMHYVLHKSRCLFNMHSPYNPYTYLRWQIVVVVVARQTESIKRLDFVNDDDNNNELKFAQTFTVWLV